MSSKGIVPINQDLITTSTWSLSQLTTLLNLAKRMKNDPKHPDFQDLLKDETFLMFFFNPSLRTHVALETAATQLGAHAQYRAPEMSWNKNGSFFSEAWADVAHVVSRYVDAIGVRLTMGAIPCYGAANKLLTEIADYASVPVIGLADDKFHPCQALADIMGWSEKLGARQDQALLDLNALKNKTCLITWAQSKSTRPWSSVQSHILLSARFGMNVRVAHPVGYDLDPEIYNTAQTYCESNGTKLEITNDPVESYKDVDVVYARNWISPHAYKGNKFRDASEIKRAMKQKNWKVTSKKMARTNNAIFANPMPLDREHEAEPCVADGERSVMLDVAENRLHINKAIMALTMNTQKKETLL